MSGHGLEVAAGNRFEFGANWRKFLGGLNEARIEAGKASLRDLLEEETLEDKTFLDAGSGSGLASLAARLLGARVHSFDYDPQSVACTLELKHRYFPDDTRWTVESGSVLDTAYLDGLGSFDIVYSWGVLHHTGEMWRALGWVSGLVKPGGKLYISIYNDQGRTSRHWRALKRLYNRYAWLRPVLIGYTLVRQWALTIARDSLSGQPLRSWNSYRDTGRGMSPWYDAIDWIGGFPFEVAKPEEIFDFCRIRGFELARLKTLGGGSGCNEFVFVKRAE